MLKMDHYKILIPSLCSTNPLLSLAAEYKSLFKFHRSSLSLEEHDIQNMAVYEKITGVEDIS